MGRIAPDLKGDQHMSNPFPTPFVPTNLFTDQADIILSWANDVDYYWLLPDGKVVNIGVEKGIPALLWLDWSTAVATIGSLQRAGYRPVRVSEKWRAKGAA